MGPRLGAGVELLVATDRCHELAGLWESARPAGEPARAPRWSLPLDLRDPMAAAAEIAAFDGTLRERGEPPLRAILGTDDGTAVVAALASVALGLAHIPPEAAQIARDKQRSRERLSAAGVPVPAFAVVEAGEDPVPAGHRVGFPCVVKPLLLSASRGVLRADDASSLVEAARRVRRILAGEAPSHQASALGGAAPLLGTLRPFGLRPSAGGAALLRRRLWPFGLRPSAGGAVLLDPAAHRLLVERFIPGPEVAVEGLMCDGRLTPLAIFDKPDPLDGPTFEETLYVTPSRLPGAAQAELVATSERAARALGILEGPVHAELRLAALGPTILEVAARSIGGLCSRTLRFGAGISLEELLVRHALGLPVEVAREARAAGVLMLPIPRAGRLHAVRGLELARAVPGVCDVVITVRPGERLVPLPEGHSYLGFAFARGETAAEVEAALREVQARLSFDLGPDLATLAR